MPKKILCIYLTGGPNFKKDNMCRLLRQDPRLASSYRESESLVTHFILKVYPQTLKNANVTPVYKKNSRNNETN